MAAPTVPTIATVSAAQDITAALWNAQVAGTMQLQQNQCMCELYQSVAQSFTSGQYTGFTFDSEELDVYGFHSTTTNTSRITPTIPGRYGVSFCGGWVSNATGGRGAFLRLNGTVFRGGEMGAAVAGGLWTDSSFYRTVYCNGSSDYFEVAGYQNSGSGLASAQFDNNPRLTVFWVGIS